MSVTLPPAFEVAAVRRDFPILQRPLSSGQPLVYLDSAATAQKPRSVIDKVTEAMEVYNANVHRGIYELADRMTTELEAAREKVAAFIGARGLDQIVFTSGTTMALNFVALGWAATRLKEGDEILLNEMEHHSNLVPWQMAAKRTGAVLKYIPLTPDGRLDLDQLDQYLTKRTRIVSVTGMSNVLGTVNPIAELTKRAHAVGAIIVVDGAQSVPHAPFSVQDVPVDFLAFSGHKVFGPTGVGVLYGKPERLAEMEPVFGGGNMINEVFLDRSTWADPPKKFEAGTLPFVEAVGLGAAIDYVRGIGFDAIQRHEHGLLERAHQELGQIPGVEIFGPAPEHKGAIVSFVVEGVHPHDLAELLNRHGVAVRAGHHCTMPLHEKLQLAATSRASFAFYNTLEEVTALADAIRAAQSVFQRRRNRG